MTKSINIALVDYPQALQSAVHGLAELFIMANKIARTQLFDGAFVVNTIQQKQLITAPKAIAQQQFDLIILPPNANEDYFQQPPEELLLLLKNAHQSGAILCSACASAFTLAHTGLLDNRTATTHWQLAEKFSATFPQVKLNIESLLINDGDIICAGGLMSWLDLGLEIVAQYMKPHIMRSLGKLLLVDTGKREQRYYGSFTPLFNHGDKAIVNAQHHIQANFHQPISVGELAQITFMSERTFLRHFTRATSLKPMQYIQRVRVQKACELLEASTQSFEQISASVGYDDVNSFRKVFIKVIGLSPSAFKARFV
jgi:transcriptional regulator GlxA family with amidase domain